MSNLDLVYLCLVPKAADKLPHQEFESEAEVWDYSVGEARTFLNGIPRETIGSLEEEINREGKLGVFKGSNHDYELILGFKMDYPILYSPGDQGEMKVVVMPTFDLRFVPYNKGTSKKIMKQAIKQFSVKQGDIVNGTLLAFGMKDEKIVKRDLPLLKSFLGMFRRVEGRCNYGMGNGRATYRT